MSKERRLVIAFEKQEIGRVHEDGGSFSFSYADGWFARADAFEISPRFRMARKSYSGVEVKNFLENLLPEEDNRKRIAELSKIDDNDIIGLLTITGRDSAGALQIYTEEEFSQLDYRPEHVKTLSIAELSQGIKASKSAINYITQIGLKPSLSGAQDKITCRYYPDAGDVSFPLSGGATTHIIKPNRVATDKQQKILEHWALNELVSLRLAEKLLLNIPPTSFFESKDRDLFIIQRYDREALPGTIRRIHQFDFCQLFGISSAEKYQVSNKGQIIHSHGVKEILETVSDISEEPTDRERVLNWVVFNYLIHNTDSHLKNISMISTGTGFKLAPFYDMTSVGYYRDGEAYFYDNHFAFDVGGESRMDDITDHHWRKYASDLGFTPDYFLVRIREMAQDFSAVFKLVHAELKLEIQEPRNVKAIEKLLKYIGSSVEEKAYRCLTNSKVRSTRSNCRSCERKLTKRSVLDICPQCFKKLE